MNNSDPPAGLKFTFVLDTGGGGTKRGLAKQISSVNKIEGREYITYLSEQIVFAYVVEPPAKERRVGQL